MKIGIISDTHDDLQNVRKAIEIFKKENVSLVIHAGDYVFPGVVQEFKELQNKAQLIGVFGNNDGEKIGLLNKFKEIGGDLRGDFAEKEIDGLKFGIYHGTNEELKQAVSKSNEYDIFVCGHTHNKDERRIGRTQILNPGTAHQNFPDKDGRIEKDPTVIIYDTVVQRYEFISLKESRRIV